MVDSGNGVLSLPNKVQMEQLLDVASVLHLSHNEQVLMLHTNKALPKNMQELNIRMVLNHLTFADALRVIYYQQLYRYYITHAYCGKCGTPTCRQQKSKFVFCEQCKREIYPHIAPCVIVRITRGDEILMARGVNAAPQQFGLIAGFVEIGESLEEAVIREVQEEVGLKIGNIKYWSSQPWTFPSTTLMAAFTADYVSGEITVDHNELSEAGFYRRDNLPGFPMVKHSIARRLIDDYLLNG